MQIHRLPEFPQHVETVSRWIHAHWPNTTATLEARIERLMRIDGCPPPFVALSNDEPVGVIGFRRHRRKDATRRVLFIDVLYVHESVRCTGIGSALLAEAVRIAKDFEPELFVFTDKREFYEKRGWTFHRSDPGETSVVLTRSVVD